MTKNQLPVGATALLLGLLVALLGSYADDLLGGSGVVSALQVLLWVAGGALMLGGAASTAMLRLGGRDRTERQRVARRDGGLRPSPR